MRPVYLIVLLVEVMTNVMTNGPSHLTQVTSILLVLFVTGLPMLNVQLFATQTFLNMNAVRTPTVTSVMEDIAPFTSNVSTLSHVNEDEDLELDKIKSITSFNYHFNPFCQSSNFIRPRFCNIKIYCYEEQLDEKYIKNLHC